MRAQLEITFDVMIRVCRESDLRDLEWFGLMTQYRQVIEHAFQRSLKGEMLLLVAEANKFPIGQVWLEFNKAAQSVGVLSALRVMPPFQGRGIGAQLIRAAESIFHERGLAISELGVDKENTHARRLYERLGYKIVGEQIDPWTYTPPGGAPITINSEEWVMQKELRSAVH